ncbi:phage tail tape measure protein [Aeribacillus pallidus]|uniref:phage tail tape measure protein n=1 Tax=Aeribacillus pallidus TaxID=33936 RepID=UPI003D19E9DA
MSLPMAAMGGLAIKTASDWQSAHGKIQATLGVTEQKAKELTSVAKELYLSAFGESSAEAADAVATVSRNLQDLPTDQLKEVTEQAFIIRDAFGVEINETTKMANVLMKNFGISAQESLDLLTVGFQKGGDYAGDLLDTMWEYAPQFAAMGHSAKDMMNILISGAQAGAFNLDKVGDAVKEFNIRAKDGSESTAEAFKALGLNATKMANDIAAGGERGKAAFNATIAALAAMEDPVKRNQIGVALFGTMWEDLEANVITAMTTTKDHLGQVEGATNRAGEALYNNFGTQLQETWRKTLVALEPLGLVLIDLANMVLPILTEAVQNLSTWFQGLSPTVQKLIAIIGVLVATIGPALAIFGVMVGAIGQALPVIMKLTSVFKGVITVVKALGTALRFLALNPVGLVITAIAAAVAIGIYLWKNWDSIKPKLIAIWNNVKEKMAKAWEAVKAKAVELAINLAKKWGEIKQSVISKVQDLWNSVTSKLESLKQSVVNKIQSLKDGAVSRFQSLVSSAKSKFEAAKNAILNPIETAKEKIKAIVDKIKGFFSGLKLKIPKPKLPKLPHFKISGKFSLNPPSIPKISVDWYAKGGIVDGASLIGAGEAGPEAIIPLRGQAMQPFAEAIAEKINAITGKGNNGPSEIIVPVILDGREIARVTAPYMDHELRRRQNSTVRARGGF